MKHSPRAATHLRTLTGASISALLIGGVLAAMPAAQADPVPAVNHFLQSGDVVQSETRATGHNVFGDEGVRVYTEGATSTDKAAGYFNLNGSQGTPLADAGEPSMDAQNNAGGTNLLPSTQLVIDFDHNGIADGILVGEPVYADGSKLYGDNWWLSNGSSQFVKDDAPSHAGGSGSHNNGTLDQWRAAFPNATIFEAGWSLGSGVEGDVTIYSITLGSDHYYFRNTPAATTTTTITNAQVKGSETAATYSSWHQGYANATVHQQVTGEGLVLAGQSQIIKGFSNHTNTLNARNADLALALPDAGMTLAAGSDPVAFQTVVYFQNATSGGVKFATLRAASTSDENKTISLDDNWQATRAVGSIPANTDVKLGDLIKALDNYKVIAFGVQTDPGKKAIVKDFTFSGKKYVFSDPAAAPTSQQVKTIAPDESTYAGWHQGDAAGHATIDSSALNLGATKSQVINGYTDNSNDVDSRNVNLIEALRTASYTVNGGTVFFQVPMFFTDPVSGQTKFTTLRPTDGAGAGSQTISINDQWTSSKAIGGVAAANEPVRLADILGALGDYKVLGFGVYADAGANGVVKDITWDGVKYTFKNAAPTAADVSASTEENHAVDVTLNGSDAEDDALTYSAGTASHGTVTVTGDKATYTPANGFVGQDTFTYKANDGTSDSADGTVTITVTASNVVKTTTSVKVNSAGEAVVNISCTEACSGYVQLRSDRAGTRKSANVFYYKLSAAGYMPMQFTGLANANASWVVRIVKERPAGPVQYNNLSLRKGSTASVNVVRTTAGAKVSTSGKIVVNVSCTKACEGYAQLWADGKGSDKSTNVVHYRLTKAGFKAMTFTGMPTGSAKWFVRLALTKPTPVTGTTPVFHNLALL